MTLLKTLSIALVGLGLLGGAALAAGGQKPARDVDFSFEGPFGTFDRAQLQRGYKVYKRSAPPATPCISCPSAICPSRAGLALPKNK
jgi:cytochrome c1